MDIVATAVSGLEAFHQAHPLYYGAAAFAAGMFAPKVLALAEKSGIPWFVARARARQDALLKKMGMTDEQIKAVRAREAADMRVAADELEKDAPAEPGK